MAAMPSERFYWESAQKFFRLIEGLDGPTANEIQAAIGDGESIGLVRGATHEEVRQALAKSLSGHVASNTLLLKGNRYYLGPTARDILETRLHPIVGFMDEHYRGFAVDVCDKTRAKAVVIIVFDGQYGDGITYATPEHVAIDIPGLLETTAKEIRKG